MVISKDFRHLSSFSEDTNRAEDTPASGETSALGQTHSIPGAVVGQPLPSDGAGEDASYSIPKEDDHHDTGVRKVHIELKDGLPVLIDEPGFDFELVYFLKTARDALAKAKWPSAAAKSEWVSKMCRMLCRPTTDFFGDSELFGKQLDADIERVVANDEAVNQERDKLEVLHGTEE